MFEAAHPIALHTSRLQTRNIFDQMALHGRHATQPLTTASAVRCSSPHSCVMKVTGPDVYINGLYQATHVHGGCANVIQRVKVGQCPNATDDMLRRTHICQMNDVEPGQPMLQCSAAVHWDCRTSGRKCGSNHWQHGRQARRRAGKEYFALD
jgi:hypothetical protein